MPNSSALFVQMLLITSLVSAATSAIARPRPQSAEELFRKYKSAVVKVVIRQQKIPIATGTGFFVSKDGRLVTNHHVIKNALRIGSFSVEFVLSDGRVIRDFQIAQCRDERGMDICLLKLPVQAKSFFTLSKYQPSPGETAYVIGHPQGLDYSITNGIVSAVREAPNMIGELQVTAAISPGNSGGPIFNSRGQLVGVASKFLKDGQNLNFGILVSEIEKYASKHRSHVNLETYRAKLAKQSQEQVDKWVKTKIEPVYTKLESGDFDLGPQGFRDVMFDFKNEKLTVPIPRDFSGCKKIETKKNAVAVQCATQSGSPAVFSISRVNSGLSAAPLQQLHGKKPLKEKPLPIVDLLVEEGSWAEYEKNLSESNRRYLFSIPSEAKCGELKGLDQTSSAFRTGDTHCRFSIYNDLEPDAFSASVWIQKGSHIYDFYVWMEDAALAGFYSHLPTIAVLGARTDKSESSRVTKDPLAAKPTPPPLEFQLPSEFSLTSSESLSDGTRSFVYSRSPSPMAGQPNAVYMINVLKTTFPPRDLNLRSRQLLAGTLEGFDFSINNESLKSNRVEINEMPALLLEGVGVRKNRELAVFHATVLSERATYMIFAFCEPEDAQKVFDEFRQATKSLPKIGSRELFLLRQPANSK